jgi:hypothetical protein
LQQRDAKIHVCQEKSLGVAHKSVHIAIQRFQWHVWTGMIIMNMGEVKIMSYLHVTRYGRKATFMLDDGKSDLLDRYVNLDTNEIWYTMCKQIGGKPIRVDGELGKRIVQMANQLMDADIPGPPAKKKGNWKAELIIGVLVLWWVLWVLW